MKEKVLDAFFLIEYSANEKIKRINRMKKGEKKYEKQTEIFNVKDSLNKVRGWLETEER